MHRIEAGLLIPGHGDPVSDRITAVWTRGRQVKGAVASG